MSNIRTTIRVEIVRADGDTTIVEEIVNDRIGDNPRFDRQETERMLEVTSERVLERIPGPREQEYKPGFDGAVLAGGVNTPEDLERWKA